MTEEKIRHQISLAIAISHKEKIDAGRKIIPAEFRQFVGDLPEDWTAKYSDVSGCLMCQYHRYLEHPISTTGGDHWSEGIEAGFKEHPLTFWEFIMTHSNIGGQFTKPQLQLAIKIYDELHPPINGIPNDITPVSPSEVPVNAEVKTL